MPPKSTSENVAADPSATGSDPSNIDLSSSGSQSSSSDSKHPFIDEETREMLYRSGYITQAVGFILITGSYSLSTTQGGEGSASYISELLFIAGGLIALIGILLSGVSLRISRKDLKQIIIGVSLVGLIGFTLANIMGYIWLSIMFLGLGGIGMSMLLGKEAHCFEYKEGKIMMYLLPAVIIISLIDQGVAGIGYLVTAFWFAAFIVLTIFILKKMKTPLTRQPDSKSS